MHVYYMYLSMYTCIVLYTYMYIYKYSIHTYMHVLLHICTCTYMYTYMYLLHTYNMYIHVHTYMYLHTIYIHTVQCTYMNILYNVHTWIQVVYTNATHAWIHTRRIYKCNTCVCIDRQTDKTYHSNWKRRILAQIEVLLSVWLTELQLSYRIYNHDYYSDC